MANDKNVRELVDLDVHEVSLVDRPAIRRKFLVVKREQETDMNTKSETPAAPAAEVTTEAPAAEAANTEKAATDRIGLVTGVLSAAAKAEGADEALVAACEETIAFLEKAAETEATKKADADAASKVETAAKGITAEQFEAFKSAHAAIGDLLGAVGAIQKAAESEDTEKADAQKAVAMGDALGAAVAKALEPVVKSIGGLSERIETVEKTRGASHAEGDDATTVVAKSETSLFSGIFG